MWAIFVTEDGGLLSDFDGRLYIYAFREDAEAKLKNIDDYDGHGLVQVGVTLAEERMVYEQPTDSEE